MNTDKLEKKAREAQVVNGIVESQGWKDTIGQFLFNLQESLFSEFLSSKSEQELLRLQGSLGVLKRLEHYIVSAIRDGESARVQLLNQIKKD